MKEFNNNREKAILTAFVLLAVFIGVLLVAEFYLFRIDIREDGQYKAESIRKTILSYQAESEQMTEWFFEKLNENVRLSVFILQNQMQNGKYTGKTLFDDGMVVQVRNGRAELPPGGDAIFTDLKTEDIMTEYSPKLIGTADGQNVLITSGKIAEGLYYLDWTDQEEYREFYSSQIDAPKLLNYMADAYGGEIFLLSNEAGEDTVLLGTDETEAFSNIAELGVRQMEEGNRYFSLNSKTDRYMCYVFPLEKEIQTAIYCDIVTDEVQTGIHRALTKILFAFSFLAAILVLCFSIQNGIKNGTIYESDRAKYTPEKMKQKLYIFSILSGLAIMLITVFTTFVQESYHENRKGMGILDSLELQLSESDFRGSAATQTKVDWYQYFGEKIASWHTDQPNIFEKDILSGIAQIINTDLIMAFDGDGNEIACNLDYIGFKLSDGGRDPDGTDFQKLLKGIPVVVRGPKPDFVTGQEHFVIGVPYRLPEDEGFGGLLFFVAPSVLVYNQYDADISRIYANLATDEELIMEIDPDTFEILSSSDPRLMRSKMMSLDVTDQAFRENKLDVFAHDNVLYFGISRTIRERIWYYAEEISGIVISALIYSAVTGLIFMFFCLLTGKNAMSGYTRDFYEECLSMNRKEASLPEGETSADIQTKKMSVYKAELVRQWQQLLPEDKAMTFLRVANGLIVLVLLLAGFLSKYAALSFYVTGGWQRGINPFAITAIIVLICVGRLLLFMLDLFFMLICVEMSSKEKTIAQLIYSLLRAVIIIGLIYNSLTYLGINTGALIASVGIISLALSLGAKDLVSDTLAGLGIVAEGAFQTGEIVEISGFRGVVDEIGIRTTKIRSLGKNNIKIINNSEIHNVINYSRELSMFTVSIDLPVLIPIDMVKEYLERELPVIRKEIPMIVSGPDFFGISHIDRNQMTIVIVGRCLEKDEFAISREMNMKIKERIDRMIDLKSQ